MEIFETIKNRRSIRAYKKQDLPRGTVEKLLDAARWAPSAGNVQPWEFVVTASSDLKRSLSLAAYGQRDVEEASAVIVVCADEKLPKKVMENAVKRFFAPRHRRSHSKYPADGLLAWFRLMLGGRIQGGTSAQVDSAPKNMRPVAMILVGYPDEAPEARVRRPLSEIMHKETF